MVQYFLATFVVTSVILPIVVQVIRCFYTHCFCSLTVLLAVFSMFFGSFTSSLSAARSFLLFLLAVLEVSHFFFFFFLAILDISHCFVSGLENFSFFVVGHLGCFVGHLKCFLLFCWPSWIFLAVFVGCLGNFSLFQSAVCCFVHSWPFFSCFSRPIFHPFLSAILLALLVGCSSRPYFHSLHYFSSYR